MFLYFIIIISNQTLLGQEYNVYKIKIDTSFLSGFLGYEKKKSITLPEVWQYDIEKKYPLIIIFDMQNQEVTIK